MPHSDEQDRWLEFHNRKWRHKMLLAQKIRLIISILLLLFSIWAIINLITGGG